MVKAGIPSAAHEVLESLEGRASCGVTCGRDWRRICVAITHAARGNRKGAERLVQKAGERLTAYAATGDTAYGLDLDAVTACARALIDDVA